MKLSSVIPLGNGEQTRTQNSLQSVVVIDSGINSRHIRLRNYIDGTYDFGSSSSGPCVDNVGHGSSVAGLAIYGGDLRRNTRPLAKVIMVKNFELVGRDIQEINRDAIDVIRQTIERYRFTSRVINLSFNAEGPNPSLTKTLDEIAFINDCVITVSAGNISPEDIGASLDFGQQYPEYIINNPIFFPADCQNVITVGSHTSVSSNFVPIDCPSPFTKGGFSQNIIKPEVMASGGNYDRLVNGSRNILQNTNGLGIISASNVGDQQSEGFGTSFSSPIVACIVSQILGKRIDLSPFLVKALLIAASSQMVHPNCNFPETIQGFGKVDRTLAVYSQEWRVCYLMQGEFKNGNSDEYHHYRFLFPEEADQLEIVTVCGRLHTGYDQENSTYLRLYFNRPGVKPGTPLKRGVRIGPKRCSCTKKERISIERGSKGPWTLNVYPHFSRMPVDQRIKYGIVITVTSSKLSDIYTAITRWIEPQKERLLVPAVIR